MWLKYKNKFVLPLDSLNQNLQYVQVVRVVGENLQHEGVNYMLKSELCKCPAASQEEVKKILRR